MDEGRGPRVYERVVLGVLLCCPFNPAHLPAPNPPRPPFSHPPPPPYPEHARVKFQKAVLAVIVAASLAPCALMLRDCREWVYIRE